MEKIDEIVTLVVIPLRDVLTKQDCCSLHFISIRRCSMLHYNTHETDKERIADCDEWELPDQWQVLVSFRGSQASKERSARNKTSRAHEKTSHATGQKSFAQSKFDIDTKSKSCALKSKAELKATCSCYNTHEITRSGKQTVTNWGAFGLVAGFCFILGSQESEGYFLVLFSCMDNLLVYLNVKNLVLPAAEDAESLWRNKFGFNKMSKEELMNYPKDCQMMIFQGTAMLHKLVVSS